MVPLFAGFLHHPKGRKIRSVTDGRPCPKALTFELRVGMMSRVRNTQRKLRQKNGGAWLYCRSFVVGLFVCLVSCLIGLCCVVLCCVVLCCVVLFVTVKYPLFSHTYSVILCTLHVILPSTLMYFGSSHGSLW